MILVFILMEPQIANLEITRTFICEIYIQVCMCHKRDSHFFNLKCLLDKEESDRLF